MLTGSVVISYVSNGAVVTKEVPAGFQFNPATGQVTPITNPILQQITRLARLFSKYLPNIPGTTYVFDHTIYNVSPTTTGRTTTGGVIINTTPGGNNNQ